MMSVYSNIQMSSLNQDLYELIGKKVTYSKLKSIATKWNTGFQVAVVGINGGPWSKNGGILLAYGRDMYEVSNYMSRNYPRDVVYKSMYIPTKCMSNRNCLAAR